MKKLSSILFILVLFSGCSTSYHINKAREKCPECFELDTTISEIVFKLDTIVRIDTNITVILPRDTVRIEKAIPFYVTFEPIKEKNGIITTEVSAFKGKLKVLSYLDSSMIYHYEDEILFRDALITKLRTINTEQTIIIEDQVNELKWYEKVWRIGKFVLIGIVGLLLFAIVYKIIKWIKK